MRYFLDRTFQPFFVITGTVTALGGLKAFRPKWTVEAVEKIAYIPQSFCSTGVSCSGLWAFL